MSHTYYRMEFKAVSSIAVGSGENTATDHDLMRHKDGTPYIPASAIAGVFRHYYAKSNDNALTEQLFGTIDGTTVPSALLFYDAEITGEYHEAIRDSVCLKDKVGVKGAKFDMEAVESGARFVTYLEIYKKKEKNQETNDAPYIEAAEELLRAMQNGLLRFGFKTARGYGETKITDIRRIRFDLQDPAQLDAWLDFNLMDDACWSDAETLSFDALPQDSLQIQLQLRQRSGLSIRTYSTRPSPSKNLKEPDFTQMTLQNGKPVISGTSWAGAFRDRFRQLSGDQAMTDELFGALDTHPSRILFTESQISDANFKEMTRNSIDRFSSATKNTALYTERTCYDGQTSLTLTILPPSGGTNAAAERALLAAALLDLHNGYLALGGLTSIGRGLFSVTQITVNGVDRTALLKPEHVTELLEV